MKYIKGLDTIRAFAVFLVLIAHWGPYFSPHTVPALIKDVLIPNGLFGVNLFFVLSGFLISGILLKEKIANEGHQGRTIKVFYIRRFLRIFPIYYLVIFIAYALNPGVREYIWYYVGYSSNILPAKVLFDSPLVHTWSLAIEEQFYLIWPWLLIFVNRKYIKHVLLGFILIGIATRWAVYTYHWPMMVFNCFDSGFLEGDIW